MFSWFTFRWLYLWTEWNMISTSSLFRIHIVFLSPFSTHAISKQLVHTALSYYCIVSSDHLVHAFVAVCAVKSPVLVCSGRLKLVTPLRHRDICDLSSTAQRIVSQHGQRNMLARIMQNENRCSRTSWYFWHTAFDIQCIGTHLTLFRHTIYSMIVWVLKRTPFRFPLLFLL